MGLRIVYLKNSFKNAAEDKRRQDSLLSLVCFFPYKKKIMIPKKRILAFSV